MSKQEEAQKAWEEYFERKARFDYSKAHFQSEGDADYIQGVSMHSRNYGMIDFKLALTKEIEKEIESGHESGDTSVQFGLNRALELLNEVKPLEP